MKKNKYENLIKQIIDLVGGKDNFTSFVHCVTRLRFNVKDKSKVDTKAIEKLEGVVGINWSGTQLQIIIGQNVADVYLAICQEHNIMNEKAIDENLDGPKKKFSINAIFDGISGCIIPILPLLIGVGFIKIVLLLGSMSGLLSVDSSTYIVLNFVSNAGFNFLPVFIGATAAKKFGANMGLGMLVGAMFMHPTFVSLVAEGTDLSVFGIPIYPASYTSTIFPTLLTVWIMAPIEKFIARKSPESLRVIVEPFLTILIIIPLALCVLGPIGAFFGQYLSTAVLWLYDTTGFFGVAVLASMYPMIVMTGMHTAFTSYRLNSIATIGYEPIVCTAMVLSNINQGAACIAVAIKSKSKEMKSTASSCAISAIVAGITEPAMYGVNLRLKKPMYAAMIGSFCGGIIAGFGRAACYEVFGSAGIFALPTYLTSDLSNLIWMIGGVVVGMVITFIATMIMYKDVELEVQ